MNTNNRVSIQRGVVCRVITSTIVVLSALFAGSNPLHAARKSEPSEEDRVPAGVSASDWQSIRAAHEAWKHAIEPVKGGWQARNPAQQWTTEFDGRGFEAKPQSAEWTWGLELRSYGAGDEQRAVNGTPEVKAEGHRLAYHWDDTVQEWFVNDGRGLEHGFSVQERPPGPSDAPLTFVLATRGPLRAAVTDNARAVDYRDQSGATVLTYSGLRVWDADGRELDARFAPAKDGVTLQVDARDARYPLLIDPIAQQAYLKRLSSLEGANFGCSVAISGDTFIAGDVFGRVFVFVRSGTQWVRQAVLQASNTAAGDYEPLGDWLAIDGDTIVVGAAAEDSSTTGINTTPNENADDAGAAYVFVRNGTTWTQQAYLKASNAERLDKFGGSVAISGNTIVIGADSEEVGPPDGTDLTIIDAGAAYVFVRNGTTWTQQAYLKASNAQFRDRFGDSVAISGETIVVGAPLEDSTTTGVNTVPLDSPSFNSGAAYVFTRSGTQWTQRAYLKASNSGKDDNFGGSVAISGRTIVVGAYREDSSATAPAGNASDNSAADAGAAYVFVDTGSPTQPQWQQQSYLKGSRTRAGDYFGQSVGLAGDTIVVGAYGDNYVDFYDDNTLAGVAYVFVRNSQNSWSEQSVFEPGAPSENMDGSIGDKFGISVAISGERIAVGAPAEDGDGLNEDETGTNDWIKDSGAVYVFNRSSTTWAREDYIKEIAAYSVRFGSAVAISGNQLLVSEKTADGTGSVYRFTRSGNSWAPIRIGSRGDAAGDDAGAAIAIDGDTFVIGAPEAANSPNPSSAVENTGAAYVNGGPGSANTAYLKANNAESGDQFGASIAISGDTIVVGAPGEDTGGRLIVGGPDQNNNAKDSGAAYVFVRDKTSSAFPAPWVQQAFLKSDLPKAGDAFGASVAIEGNRIVVGAPGDDKDAIDSGAAHVFVRDNTNPVNDANGNNFAWPREDYLKSLFPKAGDALGTSVDISGKTIVVGAPNHVKDGKSGSGKVHVFVRQEQPYADDGFGSIRFRWGMGDDFYHELFPNVLISSPLGHANFGASVAIEGDTIAIGAPIDNQGVTIIDGAQVPQGTAEGSGAVYLFKRSAPGTYPTWQQTDYIKAPNNDRGDRFGTSVALSAGTLVVGAPYEDHDGWGPIDNNLAADSGSAYVYAGPEPVITSATTASGQVGTAFTKYKITTTGGVPTSFGVTGSLPAGLTFNSTTGEITGTPTQAGSFTVTLTASNAAGSDAENLTITIAPAPMLKPEITSATTASGQVGTAFTYQITTTGGVPNSFGVTGSLPAGLTLNSTTGAITGTPTQAGSSTVTLTASNAAGSDAENLTITIAPAPMPNMPPVITTVSLPDAVVGAPYNVQISTSGGTPTSFDFAAAVVPVVNNPASYNLQIDNTGKITGTPQTAAKAPLSVKITASNGAGSDTKNYTLNIKLPQPPVIGPPLAATGKEGMAFSYTVNTSGGTPTLYAASNLPKGLSMNQTTGEISGTPALGSASTPKMPYKVTLYAYNANGKQFDKKPLSLHIEPANSVKPKMSAEAKILPKLRTAKAGKTAKIMVMVQNNTTQPQTVQVVFNSSNSAGLPAPQPVTVTLPAKKSETSAPTTKRFSVLLAPVATSVRGASELTASINGEPSAPCLINITPK